MTELSRRSAAPSTTSPRSTSTGMGKSTVHGSSGAFVSNRIRATGSRSMGVVFIPTKALRVVEIIVTGTMAITRMRWNVEGSIDAVAQISGAVNIVSWSVRRSGCIRRRPAWSCTTIILALIHNKPVWIGGQSVSIAASVSIEALLVVMPRIRTSRGSIKTTLTSVLHILASMLEIRGCIMGVTPAKVAVRVTIEMAHVRPWIPIDDVDLSTSVTT